MGTPSSISLVLLLSCIFSGYLFAAETRKKLRTEEMKTHQISQIGLTGQLDVIDPTRVTQVAWRPRVFLYRSFLSEEECDHLIAWVQGKKSDSVTDGNLRKVETANLPTKSIVPLNTEDEVVARIEERISSWTFIPKENGRPLQVLHFDSEESKQHHDYFGKEIKILPNEPLMATVVLYLSNASQGGQIIFPESENDNFLDCTSTALKPIKGNAVLFFNVHLNASPDKRSSHARCPILDGEVWCATKFFHLRATGGKEEPLQLDDTDCADEDENCPHWAATGECQRNPVFMVGSPDYYGTCRKSCNVCSLLD